MIEFKGIIDNIKLNISTAYHIVSRSEKKWGWLLDQDYYRAMNVIITDFVKATDWLDNELAKKSFEKQSEKGQRYQLIQSWIQAAKQMVEVLEKTSSVSTTFEDSLGMGDGGCGLSNIVLNLKDVNYDERPYYEDSLYKAAEILLDNGEFDLSSRYALMSAIESVWSGGRYDHEDVIVALNLIPFYLWRKKDYVKYVDYMIVIFDWLFEFNNQWGEQYDAYIYLQHFCYDVLNDYKDLSAVAKVIIIDYWKKAVTNIVVYAKGGLLFDDYLMSYLIDEISKDNKYDEALQIIRRRIDVLLLNAKLLIGTKQDDLEEYLKSLNNLIHIGFELKEQNIINISNLLNKMKSDVLENRVYKLANKLGYIQPEHNDWYYKNDKILEFIKDKNSKTLEIDVNQSKIEHKSGKEGKILFFSECKYKSKPATIRDLEFFYHKAIDFLEQQKEHARLYPKKLPPRFDKLWFVSINGFTNDAMLLKHKIGRCIIKQVDGAALNKYLEKNHIRKIEII